MSHRQSANALAPSSIHAPSYYAATVTHGIDTPPLEGAHLCDVCIIGGGFTGCAAALHLARRGLTVKLLEQSRLGWGASGRNGGQAHVGLRRDQTWLEGKLGVAHARKLWDLALEARTHLDSLIADYGIECDYRSGLLHADHKARYTLDTRRYVAHLQDSYGYQSIRYVDREEIRTLIATDGYYGASFDARGGHLHPLNLVLGIARGAQSHGAQLHEDAEVVRVAGGDGAFTVSTRRAQVRAGQVILACNGYLRGISASVEAHVMPINNYIAVTEPLGIERAAAIVNSGYAVADSRFVVNYYRMTADHRLLFGGGENYSYRFPNDIAGFVRPHMSKVFPQLRDVGLDYAWGGTLAITPSRMPFIREIEPGFYNASGFSGLGVVLAPFAGKVLAEAIGGDRRAFDEFARVPVPRFPGGPALRWPTLVAAMFLYALRDRL
ncbi:MAG TPA: FAD-binding oxidoreductase [Steroidobacteraceae bacterium]